MNKLYDKYPVTQRRVKPRLHPVVQLAVNEYNAAHREQRDFNWSVLTVDTVAPLCQQQAAQNPKWHPDISSPSLDSYLGRLVPTGSGGTSLRNRPLWRMMVRISL